MSSLEYKKKLVKNLSKNIENFLFKYTKNNAISGYIVAMIHWLVMYIVYMYILLGNANIFYYLCCAFLVITYMLHIYFSGCILIRIERIIWNTDKWWGIWTLFFLFLQKLGIRITKTLTNYTYTIWVIYVTIIIALKILISNKNKKFKIN